MIQMAEYIDRQAVINAVQQHREGVLGGYEYDEGVAFVYAAAHNHIIDVIKHLPSSDVQPVVRCKDCKHWNDAPAADGLNSCEMDALIRHESFFCANGERKDGEQNGSID